MRNRQIRSVFLVFLLASCQNSKVEKNLRQRDDGAAKIVRLDNDLISIPYVFLDPMNICRDVVEVREGPSSYFHLTNFLLLRGESVLRFERSGSFVRVFIPRRNNFGWVHYKGLEQVKKKPQKALIIKSSRLPVVFAIRNIRQFTSFVKNIKRKIYLPKGDNFSVLKVEKERTLVWMPARKNVAWLRTSDAQ